MAKTTRSSATASTPINWPLAIGIAGVAGVGAWLLMSRRSQAAQRTGQQLPGQPPAQQQLPGQPPAQPQTGQPPAQHQTLVPTPTNAPRRSIPAATIGAIQTELRNLFARCPGPSITVDNVWGAETDRAMRSYIRKYNASNEFAHRNPDADLLTITPANAAALLTSMRQIIPEILSDPVACRTA